MSGYIREVTSFISSLLFHNPRKMNNHISCNECQTLERQYEDSIAKINAVVHGRFACITDRILALHKAVEARDDVLRVLYPHKRKHWEENRKKEREMGRRVEPYAAKNLKPEWQVKASRIADESDPNQAHELARQLLALFDAQNENLINGENDSLPDKIRPRGEKQSNFFKRAFSQCNR